MFGLRRNCIFARHEKSNIGKTEEISGKAAGNEATSELRGPSLLNTLMLYLEHLDIDGEVSDPTAFSS